MSISNIRLKRYIAFWKPIGRVVAIRPVKPRCDAEKWQKEACLQTIWIHFAHARMQVYERARLLRLWYTMRAYRAGLGR
jgi:hypothetical protein